jgi:hypothetical protein
MAYIVGVATAEVRPLRMAMRDYFGHTVQEKTRPVLTERAIPSGLSPILLVPVVMDDCLLTVAELVFLLDDRLAVSGFSLLDHGCSVAIPVAILV